MILLDGFTLLGQLDLHAAITLFWFAFIFEIPRYVVGGLAVVTTAWLTKSADDTDGPGPDARISVVVVGHNEAKHLPTCIASICEQTIARRRPCQIIVVDDGSTDDMARVATELQEAGMIETFVSLDRRGGKSAAMNLALEYATGDFIFFADVDTSFDRYAFEAMLRQFDHPRVGAVAGNLGVRNAEANLLTRCQAVEYMIGVSLGRRLLSAMGVLFLVSGAMGAFRRAAILGVGGLSVEVGEDADFTAKIRCAGWKIRFAHDAWGLTDVPESLPALIRQRMRWERSVITVWMRKFGSIFDPRSAGFSLREVIAAFDVLFFQVALSIALVVYLAWLFVSFGWFAWPVIVAATLLYAALSTISYLAAIAVSGRYGQIRLLPYVAVYVVLTAYGLRVLQLCAYLDELIFHRSYRDPYVPRHVMEQVEKF